VTPVTFTRSQRVKRKRFEKVQNVLNAPVAAETGTRLIFACIMGILTWRIDCAKDSCQNCRTFQESEVKNMELRHDLYEKMISLDACEPTSDEHDRRAITKLRYMQVSQRNHCQFFTVQYEHIKRAMVGRTYTFCYISCFQFSQVCF